MQGFHENTFLSIFRVPGAPARLCSKGSKTGLLSLFTLEITRLRSVISEGIEGAKPGLGKRNTRGHALILSA
jgi:hypothetical protein